MSQDKNLPNRKSIRLKEYDYSKKGSYYITICIDDRDNYLFGDIDTINKKMILNEFGKIVEKELLFTEKHRDNIQIDTYIIMPNHIHFIITITRRGDAGGSSVYRNKKNNFSKVETVEIQGQGQEPGKHGGIARTVNKTLKQNSIGSIIGQIKSITTKKIKKAMKNSSAGRANGIAPTNHINNINQNSIKKIWQRNFYEHIIRSVDDYNRIAEYIKNNPINWKHDDFNNDGINN